MVERERMITTFLQQEELDRAEARLKEEMDERQSIELKHREVDMEHRSLKQKSQQLQKEFDDLSAQLQSERNQRVLKDSALQDQLKMSQRLQEEAGKALSQQEQLASLLEAADGSKGVMEGKMAALMETNTQLQVSYMYMYM